MWELKVNKFMLLGLILQSRTNRTQKGNMGVDGDKCRGEFVTKGSCKRERKVYNCTGVCFDVWFKDNGTNKKTGGGAGGGSNEDAQIFVGRNRTGLKCVVV